eukprot:SAG31_NODE_44901_length_261_cov_0.574074_1_plen_28_part_10
MEEGLDASSTARLEAVRAEIAAVEKEKD